MDDQLIEKTCRALIESGSRGKVDPETLVQAGTPTIYGTPSGDVFAVAPGAECELWRMYIPTAKNLLGIVQKVIDENGDNHTIAA